MSTGSMVSLKCYVYLKYQFASLGGHHGHDVFASCSTDRTIAICALSDIDEGPCVPTTTTTATTPLQVLVGHADEVNAIRWDPPGKLLASCSDDHNVFVWQLGQHPNRAFIHSWLPYDA